MLAASDGPPRGARGRSNFRRPSAAGGGGGLCLGTKHRPGDGALPGGDAGVDRRPILDGRRLVRGGPAGQRGGGGVSPASVVGGAATGAAGLLPGAGSRPAVAASISRDADSVP